MNGRPWKWIAWLWLLPALLAACGPTEQQKAKQAEAKRIECMDTICEGETPPRVGPDEFVMKLHGQYFAAPRAYGGYGGSLAFFWPSKAPTNSFDASKRAPEFIPSGPNQISNFNEVAIQIFLTGRQRWPTPGLDAPWVHSNKENRWAELQQTKGLNMERVNLSPVLDIVRFRHPDGKPYAYTYYVATTRQRIRGSGPPVLSCLVKVPPQPDDFCTSGEFWQPDVYADFRFSAKHAQDWPAIHEEIVRVLGRARSMQPS